MSVSDLILAISILILSISVFYIYWSYQKTKNRMIDTEVKNVMLELEVKKRELKDEIDSIGADELFDRRNNNGEGN